MHHNIDLIGHPDFSFNHCASIIVLPQIDFCKDKSVIVGYCGAECTDEQRVFIYFNGKYTEFKPRTGNPIIWIHNSRVNILYSIFEDMSSDGSVPLSPVDRWKFCSNHHINLSIKDFIRKLQYAPDTIEEESIRVNDMFGLLVRCQPISSQQDCFIPMYREKDPVCELWSLSSDNHLIFKSRFGESSEQSHLGQGVAIQPTFFHKNGRLCSLMRNVSRSYQYAWASFYDEEKWSKIEQTKIPNENNSLVYVCGFSDLHEYIVFNPDRTRSDIRLHHIKSNNSISLRSDIKGTRNGCSYPNYAWSGDSNENCELHIVHSNCGMIAHHTFSIDFLAKTFRL